jgi:hypothetical protein
MYAINDSLKAADRLADMQTVVLCVIRPTAIRLDEWTTVHAITKAICKFDDDTSTHQGSLKQVQCVTLTLSIADIVSAVLKQMLLKEVINNCNNQLQGQTSKRLNGLTRRSRLARNLNRQVKKELQRYAVKRLIKKGERNGKSITLLNGKSMDVNPRGLQKKILAK